MERTLPILSDVTPGRLARAPLERCVAGERFFDYVLERYEPLTQPVGKLRSVNLLVESFAVMGVEREGLAVIAALREGLGPHRTVWGVKRRAGSDALAWELYFYDRERRTDLSIARVVELLAPFIIIDAREPRPLAWHMFSVELDVEALRAKAPAQAHVYLDMRSYALRGETLAFENIYTFHDPRRDVDEVLQRIRSSPRLDPRRLLLQRSMPPDLRRCHRMCVANKRTSDALYFARVPTAALARFLGEHGWPAPLRDFVDGHGAALDPLCWDVGVDWSDGDGGVVPTKSGFYGHF